MQYSVGREGLSAMPRANASVLPSPLEEPISRIERTQGSCASLYSAS